MSLEADLYQLLSTDASIQTALNGVNNIYPGAIPKGRPDSPAIVIQVTGGQRFKASDGTNLLTMKQVQFDSYAVRYTDCLAVSEAIRLLVQDLSGSLATTNINGVIIEKDLDMEREPGDSGYVFRRLLEFHFWYTDGVGSVPFVASAPPVVGANAGYLENVPVSTTLPADGQALIFNAADGKWEPGSAGASASAPTHHNLVGLIDGNNKNFVLSPSFTRTVFMNFRSGMLLKNPDDYTRSGDNITFVIAPSAGPPSDNLDAYSF